MRLKDAKPLEKNVVALLIMLQRTARRLMFYNGWRYGLVKADHYRPIEEQNLIQPLLTIPHVTNWCGFRNENLNNKYMASVTYKN